VSICSADEQVIARDPGGFVAVGTTFDLTDRFTTENNFHGGEVGFVADFYQDIFTFEVLAKIALGNIQRTTTVSGESIVTPPPLGHTNHDFAVFPEIGLNLKVALTQSTSFTAGYSLLMLNEVARSGEQIDAVINTSQIGWGVLVGEGRPSPLFADSDFWILGVQLGLLIEL
jgi:hypothetical protein